MNILILLDFCVHLVKVIHTDKTVFGVMVFSDGAGFLPWVFWEMCAWGGDAGQSFAAPPFSVRLRERDTRDAGTGSVEEPLAELRRQRVRREVSGVRRPSARDRAAFPS